MSDSLKYFAIIIPGLPPIIEFQQIGEYFTTDLNDPIALYYSIPPYQNLQFLGAIANQRPSDTFTTGFPLNPQITDQTIIKIALKIEPLENLKQLVIHQDNSQILKEYSKKVAENLYSFMMSYNREGLIQGPAGQDYLVIPFNFIDKWYERFENKFRIDPNFMFKS